ncbi:phosphopantetheine-binding protein [Thermodesulfobacteriota bacterium]
MTIDREDLKKTIIKELFLEDITPEEIDDDAPLFGEGLDLDSLDAVELVVIMQKHYKVEIKDMDEGRAAFESINSLASFIEERQSS